jgi:tetratricopeptide (TPR) repeat protein
MMRRSGVVVVQLLLWLLVGPGLLLAGQAGSDAATPAGRRAQAYYQFLLARHLESEGQIPEALEALEAASRLDPSSAEVFAELSALHARQDQAGPAVAAAERALSLDPANGEANRVLGFVYAALARVDEHGRLPDASSAPHAARAIRHLEAARRTDRFPEIGAEFALARLYLGTGAPDKAIAVLRRIVELEPQRAQVVRLLADAYRLSGRPGEAVALLDSAVGLHPGLLPVLAALYEEQQRWREAVATYERALAHQPGNSRMLEHLGDLLLRQGRRTEALDAWQRALAGDRERVDLQGIERKIREAGGRERTP